jgi:UDP-N-acetylglucosamine 2-epimerase (non-hydrolysing)
MTKKSNELATILFVFGTRPEAIKMAPLMQLIAAEDTNFIPKVCVTGQHREMLDQILQLFDTKPDFDLDIMKEKQDLTGLSSRILAGMKGIYETVSPDAVIVHGDTTTALASAQAAFFSDILVGHVEAGLRTFDLSAPFPEEFNRQVISKIANWHFAPTMSCKENLIAENIEEKRIFVTGNTVIDALLDIRLRINRDEAWRKSLSESLTELCREDIFAKKYVLITGHRRENMSGGFHEICHAVKRLSENYKDLHFVYPVHLNPNVREPVNEMLGALRNVHLIPPQDYDAFVYLLDNCFLVLTDSGGIQEEAPSLGKPVLVMRDKTERPEAVAAGTVELVGADENRIYKGVQMLIEDKDHFKKMSEAHNPYGNGQAARQILDILNKDFE